MSFGGSGSGSGSISGSTDVLLSSPSDNQVLSYAGGSTNKWENKSIAATDVGAVPLSSGGQAMRVVGYGTSLPASGQAGDVFFLQGS